MDPAEKYERDLAATVAAVRQWQRRNPLAKPVVPHPDPAVLAPIKIAMERYVVLEGAALALATYVAGQVSDTTWMMFWAAWKHLYGEDGPQGGNGATDRSPRDKPN